MLGYEYTLEDFKQNNYEKGRDEITTKVINRMLTIQYSLPQIIAISDADEETIRTIAKENGLTPSDHE